MHDDDARLRALPDPAALIFDLDGTVVDTVPLRIDTWLGAFQEAAIPATRAQVAALIGSDGRRLARTVAAAAGLELDDAAAEHLDRRAGEWYEAANRDPRPLPGATALLRALAGSALRSAIATSSRAAQVTTSVNALGLATTPLVVDGSHVRHAKPAPDLLLLAARRLRLEPVACWYVGDARWDIEAANAAGMVALGVPSGAVGGSVLREAGAAAIVPDLTALQTELGRRGLLEERRG
ncbi:MAG: HAD family hydrolase [Candidatus Limnocylindrales bacterium]